MRLAETSGHSTVLGRLRSALDREDAASLVAPGHSGYEAARLVWNAAIDRHPAAIFPAASTEAVARAVRGAREADVAIAVRGGGHGVAGFGTIDDGLVIDLSAMPSVTVDAERGIAVAQGGARLAGFDAATQAHGLACTMGLVSLTGVGGLTLGGGVGWLARWMGLACDNLVAATVVDATGQVRRASAEDDADLLWALRGGGGNFGVATELEFHLRPLGQVTAGLTWFPGSAAGAVCRAFRDVGASAPDEASVLVTFMTGPDDDTMPEALRGRPAIMVAACHVGIAGASVDRDFEWIRRLDPLAGSFEPMPYTELQQIFDGDFAPGERRYIKGGFTSGIPDGMIEVIDDWMSRAPSPSAELDLHQMGGAIARVDEGSTAFADRHSPILFNILTHWSDPRHDELHKGWVRGFAAALARFGDGRGYVNFLSEAAQDGGLQSLYGDARYERLVSLKQRYDPDNVFRTNQNIRA